MRGRDEGGRDDQGTKGLEDQGDQGTKKRKNPKKKKKKIPKINTSPFRNLTKRGMAGNKSADAAKRCFHETGCIPLEKHTISWEVRLKICDKKKLGDATLGRFAKAMTDLAFLTTCFRKVLVHKSVQFADILLRWVRLQNQHPPPPKKKKHFGTVDGQNPTPVEVGSLCHYLEGSLTSQVVVWDFFHQQYLSRICWGWLWRENHHRPSTDLGPRSARASRLWNVATIEGWAGLGRFKEMGTNQANSKNPPQTNNEKAPWKMVLGRHSPFLAGASLAFFFRERLKKSFFRNDTVTVVPQ